MKRPPDGVRTLMVLWIALSTMAGCDAQNRSNGVHGQLTFYASSPLPVGLARVEILDGTVNVSNCHFTSGSYGIPGASCSESDVAVVELISASCAGVGCVVESTSASGSAGVVTLRTSDAGTARLAVRVRLADGREKSDEIDLHTVHVTEMQVHCERGMADGEACPGVYGVFAGARWSYFVTAMAGDAPISSFDPEIVLDGTSVTLEPGVSGGSLYLVASTPGTTHVTIRVGGQTWSADLRVASPSEVVDVALLAPTADARFYADDPLNRGFDTAVPFPSTLPPGGGIAASYPVWSLADGSRVPGGVGTIVSSDPSVVEVTSLSAPSPYWWFAHFTTHPGTAVVTASMGSVSRAFPITVE